jgi:hypothetical protein
MRIDAPAGGWKKSTGFQHRIADAYSKRVTEIEEDSA